MTGGNRWIGAGGDTSDFHSCSVRSTCVTGSREERHTVSVPLSAPPPPPPGASWTFYHHAEIRCLWSRVRVVDDGDQTLAVNEQLSLPGLSLSAVAPPTPPHHHGLPGTLHLPLHQTYPGTPAHPAIRHLQGIADIFKSESDRITGIDVIYPLSTPPPPILEAWAASVIRGDSWGSVLQEWSAPVCRELRKTASAFPSESVLSLHGSFVRQSSVV